MIEPEVNMSPDGDFAGGATWKAQLGALKPQLDAADSKVENRIANTADAIVVAMTDTDLARLITVVANEEGPECVLYSKSDPSGNRTELVLVDPDKTAEARNLSDLGVKNRAPNIVALRVVPQTRALQKDGPREGTTYYTFPLDNPDGTPSSELEACFVKGRALQHKPPFKLLKNDLSHDDFLEITPELVNENIGRFVESAATTLPPPLSPTGGTPTPPPTTV